MAQRPIWRGHLRLALVSCPVALYAAKHDRGSIRFHLINPKTGNRIRMITQDAVTEEPLTRKDLVKGYEFKKDTYLLLTDDDFDTVKVETSSIMNIEKFVEAGSIDPLYYDTSYYVAPDGDAGRDVYAVLREAVASTGRVALARVVIAQRERTIALRPIDHALVAHTLHEHRDVNDIKSVFDAGEAPTVDPEMVKLATQLIDRQTAQYDAADTEDHYETRLRAMIEAKLKGAGLDEVPSAEPDHGNVIDLMAALRNSLGQTEDQPSINASPAAKAKPSRAPSSAKPRKRAS